MSGLVLTIRIVLVRAAFAFARLLRVQRRVVFATAHAASIGGNLAILRDELASRHPHSPDGRPRPPAGARRPRQGRRGVGRGRRRVLPRHLAGVHRR